MNITELNEFKHCCNNLLPYIDNVNDEDNYYRLLEILTKYPLVKSNPIITKILNIKNNNNNYLKIITNYLFYKTTYRNLNDEINDVYNGENLFIILSKAINLKSNDQLQNFNCVDNISQMYNIPIYTVLFTFIKDMEFENINNENFFDFLRYFNDTDLTKTFTDYSARHNIELYEIFDVLIKNNVICNI